MAVHGISGIAPALLDDMGLILRRLGLETCRATVVNMGSMAFQGVWALSDHGESHEANPDLPLDSQFPGAVSTITQLSQASAEELVVQRLSPRHWSLAWRIDPSHVVIAEARYAGARAELSDIDTALVRLVCNTGIRAGLVGNHDDDDEDDDAGSMAWPALQDRRARRRPRAVLRWSLGLTVASGLLALWMAFAALPDVLTESARLRAMADRTLARHLSVAMATADYGEVQHALTEFEGLGYFQSAAVTNTRQKLVSLAGTSPGLRIGDVASRQTFENARVLDLSMGSENYGKLLVLQASQPAGAEGRFAALRLTAVAAFAAAAGAASLLLLGQRRSRRNGD